MTAPALRRVIVVNGKPMIALIPLRVVPVAQRTIQGRAA